MLRCFRESQIQQSPKVALSGNQSIIIKIMATTQNLQNFTLKLFGLWYSYKWHQMILSTRWQVYTSSLFFLDQLSLTTQYFLWSWLYFYRFLNYYASHVTISNQNRFRNLFYRFDTVIIVLVISNNNSKSF